MRQGVRRLPRGGLARIYSAPDIQRRVCSQFVPERLCFRINQTSSAPHAPGSFEKNADTVGISSDVAARSGTVPSFFERGFEWGNDSKVETTAAERAIIGRLVGGSSLGFGEAAAVERVIIGRAFSTSGGESLSTT